MCDSSRDQETCAVVEMTAPPQMQENWFALLLIALLVLATATVLSLIDRFDVVDQQIIQPLSGQKLDSKWALQGNGTVQLDDGLLSITNTRPTQQIVTQKVSVHSRQYRISVEAGTRNVVGGSEHWENASVWVIYRSDSGERLGSSVVTAMLGSNEKQAYVRDIRLADEVSSIVIAIRLLNSTGEMFVENLVVSEMKESPFYFIAKLIGVFIWVVVAFFFIFYKKVRLNFWIVGFGILTLTLMVLPDTAIRAGSDFVLQKVGWSEYIGQEYPSFPYNIEVSLLAHLLVFLVIGILVALIWPTLSGSFLVACLITFAFFTETAQMITFDRSANFKDIYVDIIGALLGYLVGCFVVLLSDRFSALLKFMSEKNSNKSQ